ncbi:hypothetical protein [Luteibacter rhizovicinus]|nr:hypothetical protein [Luteibacter rhizovicinus]KLD65559.1 hypothetical protein Y883_16395 [Luteibacter rhizovicinus DSM 16549]
MERLSQLGDGTVLGRCRLRAWTKPVSCSVERLLGQLGMETTAPTEPETGMPHVLLSDYLSGQTRH